MKSEMDEIVRKFKKGELSRQEFIQKAVLGSASAVIMERMLEALGGRRNKSRHGKKRRGRHHF